MSNLSIKQNLMKLQGATIMPVGNNKVECIVIPIEMANLFKNADGTAVYMDSIAIPLKELKADRKDTHLVKQSFSKDKFAAMTEEQRNAVPIMGNLIDWDKQNGGGSTTNKAPASTSPPAWL